jgi:ACS family allantoate permease-like MFS transporter
MSFPEDTIQLFSVVVAGIFAQVVPNSRCALIIVANAIVLIGAVLVNSKFIANIMRTALTITALPASHPLNRLGSFYSELISFANN